MSEKEEKKYETRSEGIGVIEESWELTIWLVML